MELHSGAKMVNDKYLNNVRSKNREFTVYISFKSSGAMHIVYFYFHPQLQPVNKVYNFGKQIRNKAL
jgi:hypothetical protein